MAENTNLLIRADAGAKIGSGHLMRCFALAQSWQATGGKVNFITKCESPALLEKLEDEKFGVIIIEKSYPHQSDWQTTEKVLSVFPKSWCVVDGYHFDANYHSLIRHNGNRLLVIDDTAHLEFYDADAILNQNINAAEFKYNCPSETHLLLGVGYALLREEFLQWRNWQREIPEIAQKILITMGGGDFYNQTLKAIRAVEHLGIENLQVRTVVGTSNPHSAELQSAVENSVIPVELIVGAKNMAELMTWADLAISAAGSTCWEMAFMRLPFILIVTAENQAGIADGLGKMGFAINLGWFEQASAASLVENLKAISFDKNRRCEISEMGLKIVDGRGSARVVDFLRNYA